MQIWPFGLDFVERKALFVLKGMEPGEAYLAGGVLEKFGVGLFATEEASSDLGLGCRLKTGLGRRLLMMDIPGNMLEKMHTHVLDMAKPIAMLTGASTPENA